MMTTLFEFDVTTLEGERVSMARWRGCALLIVNVASRCGFTPQYAVLERLWRDFRAQGLVVLGFPCNQFAQQEPGDAEAIRAFCTLEYDVTFPMMAKIDVNGEAADPLWRWLKAQRPGVLGSQAIKWNFTKFLVGRTGEVRDRFAPNESGAALEAAVNEALR